MVGLTLNCIQCFKIKPALNKNRFLVDLRRSSNSLYSDSDKLSYSELEKRKLGFDGMASLVLVILNSFSIPWIKFNEFELDR